MPINTKDDICMKNSNNAFKKHFHIGLTALEISEDRYLQ